MLGEFFDWWVSQLLELVPSRFRQQTGGTDALIADAGEPGMLTLFRRRRGVEQRITSVKLDDPAMLSLKAALNGRPRNEAVLLRPARHQVLERAVALPLAAERELERVLGYEMERLTPFTADEVFWGYGRRARPGAGASPSAADDVPRAAVAGLVETLKRSGCTTRRLESVAPDGVARHETGAAGTGRSGPRPVAAQCGDGGCRPRCAGGGRRPSFGRSLALSDLREGLAVLAPRIGAGRELRRRISGAGAGGDAVAAETRRLGDTLLGALAAITDILPDDSYLTEFTMRERKMTLSRPGRLGAQADQRAFGRHAYDATRLSPRR